MSDITIVGSDGKNHDFPISQFIKFRYLFRAVWRFEKFSYADKLVLSFYC